MKEKIDGTGRIRRKHRQLLDDLKEKGGYWKLKKETVDRSLWRTPLVARQIT
jgi:hypothetical protein